MTTKTAEQLREAARRTRKMAQRASGRSYYDEMAEADSLDRQAAALESKVAADTVAEAEVVADPVAGATNLGLSPQAPTPSSDSQEKRRKTLVAKVKIAQKQLGLDDDTYRDLLFAVTKQRSATKLKPWQLENVLQRMKLLGFKDKPAKAAKVEKLADDGQSRMIRGLWLELHGVGKVQDSSEPALLSWVKGQFKVSEGIEALQWLSVRQKRRIIEQLKLWLARK